ncbi:hypothetical protein Patl1_31367 [Pistacia atlantica]|uniref:Uncharacterized protein n=1 Tax=Pistacia atlantica TaxID=434234 RepID=A0ACC1AMP7_9ROSI|nr:hypothetical protein Patl1_31367 [Pistacia atlantica]
MDSCQLIELEKIAMVDIAAVCHYQIATVLPSSSLTAPWRANKGRASWGTRIPGIKRPSTSRTAEKRSSMELKATKKMGHGGAGEAGEVNQGIDIDESTGYQ